MFRFATAIGDPTDCRPLLVRFSLLYRPETTSASTRRRQPFAGTLTARHGANSRRAGKFRRGLAIVDSGRSSHDCGAVVG